MTETELPGPVVDRLKRVRILEEQILAQTKHLAGRDRTHAGRLEQVTTARTLATRHLHAIDQLVHPHQVHVTTSETDHDRLPHASGSMLAEELVETIASVIVAYGALYAAGRLMYETEVADDLAYPHGEEWRDQLSAMADLLVTHVHGQVLAEGFTCRCVCPACGMGACLCTRNSIETVRELWARPEPEPVDGIELRITPRPGSELACVGMSQGDRIVLVDGELVRTNGDLQAALRKHDIGEPIPIQVERSGRLEEIRAARVSDLP